MVQSDVLGVPVSLGCSVEVVQGVGDGTLKDTPMGLALMLDACRVFGRGVWVYASSRRP